MSKTEPVEIFDVCKSSKKARSKGNEEEQNTKNEDLASPKKELYALSSKQYNIHVSSNNILPPLKSFAEQSSRCVESDVI
uniref:Uncharacterized protein n=1 Tax=Brassica campestris TaxID=3711 RepID=A0A3P5Z789_BRACM|nr:unnamed protein product [Brassica rapa]